MPALLSGHGTQARGVTLLRSPRGIAAWPLLLLLGAGGSRAFAEERGSLTIAPGAKLISAEEQALAPDPAAPEQAGIVLLDETDRNDRLGRASQVAHHFRAKIFSGDPAELITLEIPLERPEGVLKRWWGWTICPDGSVHELAGNALREEVLPRLEADRLGILTARLEGAGPGCIVDYGYFTEEAWAQGFQEVKIQRSVQVKLFRFRWTPGGSEFGAYHLGATTNLQVSATRDSRSVLVTGKDLPAVVQEPYMPPLPEVTARVTLYYRETGESGETFWNNEAKEVSRRAAYFAQSEAVRQALTLMKLPSGGELDHRLRLAYDWLTLYVRNVSQKTSEDVWRPAGKEKQAAPRAMGLLEKREATTSQLAYFYQGVAKALGAETALALVAKTNTQFLDTSLLMTDQIDRILVAVRAPGEPDDALRFVAPGSGLPFGQIPWWNSGGRAMLATPKGAHLVHLWPSQPRQNVSETRVRVVLADSHGGLKATWSRTGTGQQGYEERLKLRRLLEGERRLILKGYCGSDEGAQVVSAAAPDIAELAKSWRLECDATLKTEGFDASGAESELSLAGPWIVPVPDFPAETRIHPIVFPFPRIDNTILEVVAPEGFLAEDQPPPILIESEYGNYARFVRPVEGGYEVQRTFSLTTAVATVEEYAAIRNFLNQVRRADAAPVKFKVAGKP